MEEIDYFAFYLFLVLTVFIVLVCASEHACAGLYAHAHEHHSNHEEIEGQLARVHRMASCLQTQFGKLGSDLASPSCQLRNLFAHELCLLPITAFRCNRKSKGKK